MASRYSYEKHVRIYGNRPENPFDREVWDEAFENMNE